MGKFDMHFLLKNDPALNITHVILINDTTALNRNVTPTWVTFKTALNDWYAVHLAICVLGSLLNILLASTVFVNGFHRKGAGPLIAQLILIEASMCLLHLPLQTFQTYMAQFDTFPTSSCAYIEFALLWTQHAGHWSGFFLAVNRLTATILPRKYTQWNMHLRCKGMMIAAWVIGFVCDFPKCLGWGGLYDLTPPWYSCGIRTFGGPYHAIAQAMGVYVPQVSLTVLYIIMIVKVEVPWARMRGNRVENTQAEDPQMPAFQKRYAVAKILFVSSVWYIICYFPNPIIGSTSLIRIFIRNPVFQLWTRTMYLCGYALNPVIFFTMSKDYRLGVKSLMGVIKTTVRNPHLSGTENVSRTRRSLRTTTRT